MAGQINDCDLMRRLHRRLTVVNHICYSIFRFQKRQKHYKFSGKVIYVLKTAMVKRKPKIRSEKSPTCIRDKHFPSWTSYLDLNSGALQMRQLLRAVASKYYLIILKHKEGTAALCNTVTYVAIPSKGTDMLLARSGH